MILSVFLASLIKSRILLWLSLEGNQVILRQAHEMSQRVLYAIAWGVEVMLTEGIYVSLSLAGCHY